MSLPERPPAISRPPRLGIAAIVRNEARYLLEWIAFHQLVGVTDFFIVDNDSNDGTTELLDRFVAAGIVTRLARPHTPDRGPQIPAYLELLSRYRDRCDWLAFIDADEFIVPTGGMRSLPGHLAKIADDRTGCVLLNWATYGSSGLATQDDRLVIERFTWRASREEPVNRHFKSIVRPTAVLRFRNPHEVKLDRGFKARSANGKQPAIPEPGQSASVVWSPFRINHYVVKSFEEWLAKRARGMATLPNGRRPETFFAQHDYADAEEPFDAPLLAATKDRMAELAAVVGLPLAPGAAVTPGAAAAGAERPSGRASGDGASDAAPG